MCDRSRSHDTCEALCYGLMYEPHWFSPLRNCWQPQARFNAAGCGDSAAARSKTATSAHEEVRVDAAVLTVTGSGVFLH